MHKLHDLSFTAKDTSMIGIVCSKKEIIGYLLALLSGKRLPEGTIWLNGISSEHSALYKKNIDVITDNFLDSSLSVLNYTRMYSMISGIYSAQIISDIEQELDKYQLGIYKEMPMKQLKHSEQLLIRLLLASMRNSQLLLCDNITRLTLETERTIQLLREFALSKKCCCILLEEDTANINHLADKLIYI